MIIRLLVVGKLKEQYWKDAVNEYCKRISKYSNIEIIEINEEKISIENESNMIISKNLEGKRILEKINEKDYVILTEINSNMLNSIEFSKKLENIMNDSNSKINFIIGGSYGVSEEIKQRANYKISFSKMTFPHQMARVILLEQIYRAFKIMHNERYHK